jgi:hypothetical protein
MDVRLFWMFCTGLCDRPIPHPENSYRVWCVGVISKPQYWGSLGPVRAVAAKDRKNESILSSACHLLCPSYPSRSDPPWWNLVSNENHAATHCENFFSFFLLFPLKTKFSLSNLFSINSGPCYFFSFKGQSLIYEVRHKKTRLCL